MWRLKQFNFSRADGGGFTGKGGWEATTGELVKNIRESSIMGMKAVEVSTRMEWSVLLYLDKKPTNEMNNVY